ncbi:LOW QUALITY PROTEIN: hypothetical protein PanWU01x14_367470 [Parasponia andersonii]|uniref:Uncharacterized protein n=1 Tax=Parasponia andersonii TaxID=3476 RepID=A0A2P5A5A3_PARAD|nr:LOW QUALITY PROTEIN: hypothetical protein PanWU01x14_367470 [Parasponia andersonii]
MKYTMYISINDKVFALCSLLNIYVYLLRIE